MSQVLSHALKATRSAVVTGEHAVANQHLQRLQTMDVQKTLMREIEFLRVVLACRTRDEASLQIIADGLQTVSSEEVKYVMDLLARVPETQDPSYVAFARRAVALLGHAPPKPDNGKIFRLIAVSAAVTAWTGWAIYLLMFGTSKSFKESTGGAMSLQESVGFGELWKRSINGGHSLHDHWNFGLGSYRWNPSGALYTEAQCAGNSWLDCIITVYPCCIVPVYNRACYKDLNLGI